MREPPIARRRAGLVVPLFSLHSEGSWGIGELTDLPRLAQWLGEARMSVVQLLPINESAPADQSPYSGLSAMAIDPQYISLGTLIDFARAGGEAGLDHNARLDLSEAKQSRTVRYDLVRKLKRHALRKAFNRFRVDEWVPATARAAALDRYIQRESWWLDDYALFRALHDRHGGQPWPLWDPAYAHREDAALEAARNTLSRQILFHQYVQWIAEEQWREARQASPSIAVFGDFPFMVAADSADVWVQQQDFRLDAAIGTPPDAFSETGQNWGLPAYRWASHRDAHLAWLERRARRSAALFDGLRIDHVVGLYRTYVIGPDRTGEFTPKNESSQLAQGEAILRMFMESGMEVTVEDLGTIPEFVRRSLDRLGAPGYRVFRWERAWHDERRAFIDPASYPETSVATTGTHDIEPLADWWDGLEWPDRQEVGRILRDHAPGRSFGNAPFDDELRDAFLALVYGARSDLVLLPVQDVFGWRDRINVPATITGENWTFRLPWSLEDLTRQPVPIERRRFLEALARRFSRG